jgi:acetylornithine/N-succinyldiaminopimelate aminotransferase
MSDPMPAAPAAHASALLDVFQQVPVRMARGEGVWLYDETGKRFLDFYGGHAVALLGYGHPRLTEALERQARRLHFQSNLFPVEVRERAAARLAAFAPPLLSKVFFVNSGAEANENALGMAFRATGRQGVVAVEGAFHGRTSAAAAVTWGSQKWYPFPEKPFPVTFLPLDDCAALERAVGEDTAAVILEPVQGVAGARALSADFLAAARAITAARGAVLIFDEVQCGMGRSGWPFVAQAAGIIPDLLTTAKGLGGGFPVSAVLAQEHVAGKTGRNDMGTTFGGGPMAAVLVEAVIDVIEEEGLLARVQRLSQRIREECVTGPVESVQGMGFLLGLRARRPARDVLADLRESGIIAGGSADPMVVRLLPSLILEDAHVDQLVHTLGKIPR